MKEININNFAIGMHNIDAIFFNRYPETDVFYPKATHIIEDLSQLKPLFL